MKNQVIKVLSKEHGKKVFEYFKSKGVDTGEFNGAFKGDYYGVINGSFNLWNKVLVESYNPEIIELHEEFEPQTAFDNLPIEIQEKMLERQVEQGNKRDAEVFRENIFANLEEKGFNWDKTPEEVEFWSYILDNGNLETFYQRYPKEYEISPGDKINVNSINITGYDEMLGICEVVDIDTHTVFLKKDNRKVRFEMRNLVFEKLTEPTYPCMMWVWDDDVSAATHERIEGVLCGQYIVHGTMKQDKFYGFKNASPTNPNQDKIQQEIKELEAKIYELKKQIEL